MKRRACVERARGDLAAAARELTAYLKAIFLSRLSYFPNLAQSLLVSL
jgi:hypothetical protein